MQITSNDTNSDDGGIQIHGSSARELGDAKQRFQFQLNGLGVDQFVTNREVTSGSERILSFQIHKTQADTWAPDGDTSQLCRHLNLETTRDPSDLEREIVLAMLLCPVPFQFPSYDELASAIRIRKNIVQAARKTSLSFATDEAERPAEYWTYDDDRGFILNPGKSLIVALQHATQPGVSGKRYTFSCRRAAEYIVLLSVASEAIDCHVELFQDLQRQAETRAVKGREFERIFHRQIGSVQNPLPLKFFVPGDRTWFRNPEKASSEITGYEGSWTFYLGNGIFADFWSPGQNYNLTTKCLSIFHWRHSTFHDANGDLQIDEECVEQRVAASLQNPAETSSILEELIRLQEPLNVYAGGSIEPHREYIRQICHGTSDIDLPDIQMTSRTLQTTK